MYLLVVYTFKMKNHAKIRMRAQLNNTNTYDQLRSFYHLHGNTKHWYFVVPFYC